jgi:hypothetical protein
MEKEELPLSKAAQVLLDECRMVLPGSTPTDDFDR